MEECFQMVSENHFQSRIQSRMSGQMINHNWYDNDNDDGWIKLSLDMWTKVKMYFTCPFFWKRLLDFELHQNRRVNQEGKSSV